MKKKKCEKDKNNVFVFIFFDGNKFSKMLKLF